MPIPKPAAGRRAIRSRSGKGKSDNRHRDIRREEELPPGGCLFVSLDFNVPFNVPAGMAHETVSQFTYVSILH